MYLYILVYSKFLVEDDQYYWNAINFVIQIIELLANAAYVAINTIVS